MEWSSAAQRGLRPITQQTIKEKAAQNQLSSFFLMAHSGPTKERLSCFHLPRCCGSLGPRSLIPFHCRISFIHEKPKFSIHSTNCFHSISSIHSLSSLLLCWVGWCCCLLFFAEHCGVPPPLTRKSTKQPNQHQTRKRAASAAAIHKSPISPF